MAERLAAIWRMRGTTRLIGWRRLVARWRRCHAGWRLPDAVRVAARGVQVLAQALEKRQEMPSQRLRLAIALAELSSRMEPQDACASRHGASNA